MPHNGPSDDSGEQNENLREYYLIRVPKSINVKELNGVQIDLDAFGPSQSVIVSRSDPDQSYGYDLIPHSNANTLSNLTKLNTDDEKSIQIDGNYSLKGFVNFYRHNGQPDQEELVPLVPTSPNDPIEDIVNRARGYSAKRKYPVKVKREKSPIKKKNKVR